MANKGENSVGATSAPNYERVIDYSLPRWVVFLLVAVTVALMTAATVGVI